MNSSTRSAALLASLFFAPALLLTGCASTKTGGSAGPSATLQGVTDDYRQAQRQTAATEEALEELIVAADLDLKQSFDYYSENQDEMEQIGTRLVTHADGMFFRGTYYFVESGKSLESCAFPRTGKSDAGQSINLGNDFDAISEAGGEVKRAYRAFQLDIEQIHDFLANHLTPSGIVTIDIFLHKAKVDSDSLEEVLGQALTALEHAKMTLAQETQKKG